MSALVARNVHGLDAIARDAPAALTKVRTFHTLDALRGVAAVAVVLFHTAFFYGINPPAEGQIAVDLFFVMSGFIIAYRYDAELRAGMRVGDFARVRLVRLYPLYLLGAVLGVIPAVLAIAAGDNDGFHRGLVESFPLHVLMMPSRLVVPKIEELYPVNYVAWSLVLEILINLAYAATFRFWTLRRLGVLIGAAFVGLCGCAAYYGSLIGGFAWPHWPVGVVRILYGFPMGVMLYRLFEKAPFAMRVPWWLLLLTAMSIFFFRAPWMQSVWEIGFISIAIPLIVCAAVANEPPKAVRGLCAMAGVFSYVVYSLHAPLVGFFLRGEERLHVSLRTQSVGTAVALTTVIVVTCVAAHLAYDKPVRRLLSRRVVRFSPTEAATVKS